MRVLRPVACRVASATRIVLLLLKPGAFEKKLLLFYYKTISHLMAVSEYDEIKEIVIQNNNQLSTKAYLEKLNENHPWYNS